ncbi:unnamed protein product [Vitrella brassicaformis CCMP3155]|uniref:Phosphate transporter n=1 Tax=Vitrella brassicaformis (strain CCMP3155) TaxID=1169540 RepID=A0A0G4GBJ3_VITBC|nr:unnamed protein product [Vitrella brassicaformis CCMP3155]|eukprot:CEM26053.1 unnamed protein product [Vitrella brassicaformis CCMP3155]
MVSDYYWIVVAGIGANDVANQFASSIGSKAINLKMAIFLSAILEFVGAAFLGGQVADTVRKKIVDFDVFIDNPELLMFGMLCALIGAGMWLMVASYLGWPVSTTHSIIGSIVGFSMATGDINAVHWDQVGMIVASWFISPILSGIAAAILFVIIRELVLKARDSVNRGFWMLPVFLFLVFATFFLYLVFKNNGYLAGVECMMYDKDLGYNVAKEPCIVKKWATSNPGAAVGITLAMAVGAAAICTAPIWWWAKTALAQYDADVLKSQKDAELTKVKDVEEGVSTSAVNGSSEKTTPSPGTITPPQHYSAHNAIQPIGVQKDGQLVDSEPTGVPGDGQLQKKKTRAEEMWESMPFNQDLHDDALQESKAAARIHDSTESFDGRTERFFAICQVLSACFDCVGHGSNDTANAVGPFAAILGIYSAGAAVAKVETPLYVLAFGGAGIAVGLALYGYRVIKAIGVKMVKITPSRGFCIELGAAWIIIIGSNLGIPLSTTHCQVGATVGVGLTETDSESGHMCTWKRAGVNWKLLIGVFGAWVLTLIFAGAVTALIFSFGAYAPNIIGGRVPVPVQ